MITKGLIKHGNKFNSKVFHDRENSENRFSEFLYFMKCLKKYISWTFLGSLHKETIVKYAFHEIVWKKYFTVYPRLKGSVELIDIAIPMILLISIITTAETVQLSTLLYINFLSHKNPLHELKIHVVNLIRLVGISQSYLSQPIFFLVIYVKFVMLLVSWSLFERYRKTSCSLISFFYHYWPNLRRMSIRNDWAQSRVQFRIKLTTALTRVQISLKLQEFSVGIEKTGIERILITFSLYMIYPN